MKIGVPAERAEGERRVAATPDTVGRLKKLGFEVALERGAGASANYPDAAYVAAGAEIVDDPWSVGEVVIKVRPPSSEEIPKLRAGQVLICPVQPGSNPELVQALAERGITLLALDCIPRITRAQKMDVLSSMANIAGYRAVVEAATAFGSFFGGQITAAGKTAPAKVLVIGAGVAGLAAVGAARGLGAVVRAFDVRPSVKEQIQSMGAQFLEVSIEESGEGAGGYAKTMSKEFIDAEMALFRAQAKEVDVVITTALIPGKRAPILFTKDMVESMRPGSVVVDMAAEQGGNCECTVPGQSVVHQGVTIIGFTDLVSRMPTVSSQFFASNITHLLDDMGGATKWRVDEDDEAVRGALILRDGEMKWPPPQKPAPPPPAHVAPAPPPKLAHAPGHGHTIGGHELGLPSKIGALLAAVALTAAGALAPSDFLQHLTVFALACFVGWQVIWNVSPALHTPLMSVTNAISGIILVGGMLQAARPEADLGVWLGLAAIFFATINIAGGFAVTQRMLEMFRRKA